MKYTAGFIGIGNMGGALLKAVCKSAGGKNVAVFDTDINKVQQKALELGVASESVESLVKNSRFVFLGVKPNIVASVISDIKEMISDDTVIVSMAAGVATTDISTEFKVIRIMPNTPVAVGEGTVLYSVGQKVTDTDVTDFCDIMKYVGVLDSIDEKLIDAAAALSGCGPAFVYMFIDSLADGAVKCGLPRDKALLYAKQTVLGSAKYALMSEKHPEKLKDEVCSPGGTTIEGVIALEKGSFRHTASQAVIAAYEKTSKLTK